MNAWVPSLNDYTPFHSLSIFGMILTMHVLLRTADRRNARSTLVNSEVDDLLPPLLDDGHLPHDQVGPLAAGQTAGLARSVLGLLGLACK